MNCLMSLCAGGARRFAGDVPWAHLDIAGPARAGSDDGYIGKGGTGFGVRTLVEVLANFEAPGAEPAPARPRARTRRKRS